MREPSIKLTSPTLTTHYLHMIANGSNNEIASGTGFIYEFEDEKYLITNGHNLTGLNPEQTTRLSSHIAFPESIVTKTRIFKDDSKNHIGLTIPLKLDLYKDKLCQKPKWFIHPEKGYLIDVIAIPIKDLEILNKKFIFSPINNIQFDTEYHAEIADDVFILGYPFNIAGTLELPIWKRGTVASEPSINIDKLPKIYVDTASRSGMSGSPVIMRRTGIHGYDGKKMKGKEMIGTIHNFIGVYSGRIGADDEFKAQLGIVWKEEVIIEILNAKKESNIEFQMI